jgi:small-conductance mechanosensitive channel
MELKELLDWSFYSNTVTAWGIAAGMLVVTLGLLLLLKRTVVRQLTKLWERTGGTVAAVACEAVSSTRIWVILLVAIRAGSVSLRLPVLVVGFLHSLMVLAILYQLAIWGNAGLRRWLERYSEENLATDASGVTTMRATVFLGRVVLWAIVLMMALQSQGYEVTTMLAGLGIGGIAIALAAQNILGDLFASLSIVIDKPFVLGDFVVVDEFAGTVDRIGLKTTRVRSLSGEQLIFSNSDLLKSRIRNYRHLEERRILFSFGVEYETPLPSLEKIPGMVREVIQGQEHTRFDRAHFKSFGSSALDFEVVYYVLVPDYNVYMDIQQAINFELFRRFDDEGIGFAYPTQKLYLNRLPVLHEGAVGDDTGKLAG